MSVKKKKEKKKQSKKNNKSSKALPARSKKNATKEKQRDRKNKPNNQKHEKKKKKKKNPHAGSTLDSLFVELNEPIPVAVHIDEKKKNTHQAKKKSPVKKDAAVVGVAESGTKIDSSAQTEDMVVAAEHIVTPVLKRIEKKKIRRRPDKKKQDMYFTKDTQVSIAKFLAEPDLVKRDAIYKREIYPAMSKLADNLIHVYGFVGLDPVEDMRNDCIAFLFETLNKFDPSRGSNAFSYFNIIGKNYLIVKSRQRTKALKTMMSMETSEELKNRESELIERSGTLPAQDDIRDDGEIRKNFADALVKIKPLLRSESEFVALDSLSAIFECADDIDIMNKNAIMLYLKEMTGLSHKSLLSALHNIRKHYKQLIIDGELERV